MGIYPLEQKIQAILDLALPTNVTQVQHIFGISELLKDIYPPSQLDCLTNYCMTKRNTLFVWMVACQTALDTFKYVITNRPVLIYPDPNKEYHLFTDVSNHTWPGVLTQQKSNAETNDNEEHTYHPITFQSGTFSMSQLKWSTIVKECYVIMMPFNKMAFYLSHPEDVLWSDSAPLEKLIKNQTQNTLTQNWPIEIFSTTPYITFKHIKGKDNILVDSCIQLQRLGQYKNAHERKMIKIR